MPGHAFILGGTGQIGRAAAAALLDAGWRVTLATRGNTALPMALLARGARGVVLDRGADGALSPAVGADVLVDTVAYDAAHADQLLGLTGQVGSLVVISSASVYADAAGRTLDEARQAGFPELPDPIPETHPTVPPGPATYSTRKMALERRLLDQPGLPVTILRPCAIHGPFSRHPREWWFVRRMRDGRTHIPLAYAGASRFHTTGVANLAAMIALAAARPATRVLNVGDPAPPSVQQIGAAIARQMNWPGRFVACHDAEYPPRIGVSPWSVPRPFLVDMQAAAALGYRPMHDYTDGVAPSIAWLAALPDDVDWQARFPVLAAYPRDHFDYAAEDRWLDRRAEDAS